MHELLFDLVVAALRIIKPEPPTRADVEPEKQVQVRMSWAYPAKPFILLIKRKKAVLRKWFLWQAHFAFAIMVTLILLIYSRSARST